MASRSAALQSALRPRVRQLDRSRVALAAVVVAAVALTVAVRTPDAVHQALWADEVGSARIIVAPSTHGALTRIRRESSPPGWFFLGRYTHKIGASLAHGSSFFRPLGSMTAVRMWSVLFSALAVAFTILYARRLLPLWGAAVAGLLVALGEQFVFHGAELRAYAMLLAFATAFPLVLGAAAERPTLRRLAGFATFVAVGTMTHYFFLAVLFTGLLWLALSEPSWRSRLRVAVAAAVGLVPLLVWLPVVVFQASRVNGYFPAFGYRPAVTLYSKFFASSEVWGRFGFTARVALVVVVVLGALLLARRAEGRLCALLAVVPVVVTAVVWVLGLRIYDTRNLIVAAPFAAICIVAAATALPWRPAAAFAGALVAAAMVWAYTVDVDLGRTPYNAIDAGLVQLGWSPSSPLLMFARYPQSRPLAWHLPGHPRLRASAPGPGRCPAAYAVVTNDAGRRWLKAHASEVAAVRRFPWYGGEPVAPRRSPDVTVARLRPSRAALADAVADRGFLFHPFGGRRPPCLGDSR